MLHTGLEWNKGTYVLKVHVPLHLGHDCKVLVPNGTCITVSNNNGVCIFGGSSADISHN